MNVKTPAECFQLFFSDTVIEFIVFKTKLYRKQNFDNDSSWQDISVAKMKGFFGIGLSIGLVNLPKFHDYWAGNFTTSVPWFFYILPRRRFFKELACLHLSDNATQPERQDLEYKLCYKLGQLPSHLSNLFSMR